MIKKMLTITLLGVFFLVNPLVSNIFAKPITLTHIHGLSYSTDGKKIFIPSHYGLAIYSENRWFKAQGPEHDYMGFSATRNLFYSSGHPAQGSGLVNPFGLMKSSDGGKTWQDLGLRGESDFHTLATSYETNVVYVFNIAPNSKMKQQGLYYTEDDGKAWNFSQRQGAPNPFTIAVHPSHPNVIALGSQPGVFLSQNYGKTFKQVATGMEVHSTFFELNKQYLWFGGFDDKPSLSRMNLETGQKKSLSLPSSIVRDAVNYIAQNPVNRNEFVITTFQRDVYLSQDQGKTWKQLARKGKTL